MCRLFATIGSDESEIFGALKKFQRLSRDGHVPKNIRKGHTEGWGMVGYRNGTIMFEKKKKGVASKDPEYVTGAQKLAQRHPEIVIGHLRKITKGTVTSRNNHPFVYGRFSFSHNGSVEETERIPLKSYFKDGVRGNTDTERLFAYLLQMIYGNERMTRVRLRQCFIKLVRHIHAHHEYTGLNLILCDGETLWVLRDVNRKNALVKSMDLLDYFSLYWGVGERGQYVICSEQLGSKGVTWHPFKNRECIEFDVKKKTMRSFIV